MLPLGFYPTRWIDKALIAEKCGNDESVRHFGAQVRESREEVAFREIRKDTITDDKTGGGLPSEPAKDYQYR